MSPIATSQLIYSANQLNGFYTMEYSFLMDEYYQVWNHSYDWSFLRALTSVGRDEDVGTYFCNLI